MSSQQHLNEAQKEAVSQTEGPVLVLAGAGSGKTRVVTERIIHLLELGIPPGRILGLTFTNKAAGEMKERVAKKTSSHVLICTFHSLGARILRESIDQLGYERNFTIYDEDDVEKLLKACFKELDLGEKKAELRSYRSWISRMKNAVVKADGLDDAEIIAAAPSDFAKVYTLYQQKLREYQAVDFDDLLYLTVRLFREHPATLAMYQERWWYLLIDEYQDTNLAQYLIVRLLVEKRKNLCVVGDPDQSIYSWRGADIGNILNFERDYPGAKIIRLEQNYRSRTTILEAANAVIENNQSRYEKNLWSDRGEGEKIRRFTGYDEREEAWFVSQEIQEHHREEKVPLQNFVIFYRTNAQSRPFEDQFLADRIPYQIIGGISFYQRREIKDILAFLRMVHSGADFVSFLRSINLPRRGLGEATIEKIRQGAASELVPILYYCEKIVDGEDLRNAPKLSSRALEGLNDYIRIIRELRELHNQQTLKELVKSTVEKTGYFNYLSQDVETFSDRKENVDELIAKAAEWEGELSGKGDLGAFLEELSLKASHDEKAPLDCVKLMTVHNGKGLEFDITFLVGLEEDLFPHVNAKKSSESIEEERRLFYVGMTRAKEYLYLTHSHMRYIWGMQRQQCPSRFIYELPSKFIEKYALGTVKK